MPEAPRTAVDKALDLVEAVARASQPPRLTDLAEEVGLHRATAYRVLVDLVRRGWVLRAGDRYLPGTAVLQLSSSAARNSLGALARPVLAALSERTGMMVNLQVPETDRSRVIDVVRPDRLAMISSLTGEALPVHRFAGPLALVAALAPADRVPYLRAAEEAGHPLTGTDGLLADIELAERTGFAVEYGRNEQPVASLARAVVTRPGAPVCALTLVGLGPEFDEARLPRLRERLREATDELGRILSGPGTSGAAQVSEVSGDFGHSSSGPESSSRPTSRAASASTSTEGPA
ncbi:IclR family transcriptional regulator [Streptomyces rhizosphaerihabitans]|uniref:IclR family transcriptional regulator n=1 Tax=Streptomyces rhizosphaerihabitans TaxID=1266770 RepID=UPI0021C0DD38|nr:helix-turn-helix domain-containing protein [Streptomyces rhizosphaerihabitans]MCT9007051.1 helix-turn-helix domain-containing protein [Streptomyces rhizosphaerihabitans]